jgi:endoglucanase Acf2
MACCRAQHARISSQAIRTPPCKGGMQVNRFRRLIAVIGLRFAAIFFEPFSKKFEASSSLFFVEARHIAKLLIAEKLLPEDLPLF